METIPNIVKKQRAYFASGMSRDLDFRIANLKKLKESIARYETEILQALYLDLHKPRNEAFMAEIGIVQKEITHLVKGLKKWAKPVKIPTPFCLRPSRSYLYTEPRGVVLIIVPWNYPFLLSINPLAGAMAAGNCVILKPSEKAPHTATVIKRMLEENFHQDYITYLPGDNGIHKTLLREKYDYIFFTGSGSVGKQVLQAAAINSIPVTLELGGKSPCIIDETANIRLAAKRIVWGKFINAGQNCVAPDYVLVHTSVKDVFIREMIRFIEQAYGENATLNLNYPRIINQKHYQKLRTLLHSNSILYGGQTNDQTNKIGPTLLDHVNWESEVMQEEIFGPLLPIMEYTDFHNIFLEIQKRPKPLSLYLFTANSAVERMVKERISFGGGCINDTMIHCSNPWLPFGGVGESGFGSYHGKKSFDTFSHHKSLMKTPQIDFPLRYPPYDDDFKFKLLKLLLK